MNSQTSITNLFKTNKLVNKISLINPPKKPPNSSPSPENLHIASLNTRGLNDETKFKCLLKFIQKNNFSIFGLSETKIKKSSKKFISNNKSIIHWSSTESSQAGVALIINPTLFKYHLKTESFQGYIISSFFNFKPSTTLCVSQIYIPHDPTIKKKVIDQIKILINYNTSLNYPHIIMGDFNSVPNPILDKLHTKTSNQKNPLYNFMNNYIDTFRHLNPNSIKFTFSCPTQQSRIDQLWISNNLSNYLSNSSITPTNPEFKSDHKIISSTLQAFYHTSQTSNLPNTFIKYNPFKLDQDDWNSIISSIDHPSLP